MRGGTLDVGRERWEKESGRLGMGEAKKRERKLARMTGTEF